jgi:hypothetical protein
MTGIFVQFINEPSENLFFLTRILFTLGYEVLQELLAVVI